MFYVRSCPIVQFSKFWRDFLDHLIFVTYFVYVGDSLLLLLLCQSLFSSFLTYSVYVEDSLLLLLLCQSLSLFSSSLTYSVYVGDSLLLLLLCQSLSLFSSSLTYSVYVGDSLLLMLFCQSLSLLLLSYLFCLCRWQSSPAAALPVSLSPSCLPLPVSSSHTIRHSNNKPLFIGKKQLFGIGMFSKNLHSFARGFKN